MTQAAPISDDRQYPSRPWVGVGVIVFKDENVLLIQRGKPPGYGQWSLPGGSVELGETLTDAAAREVFEESGLAVTAPFVVTVSESIQRDDVEAVQFHYVLVNLAAEWVAGDPVAADDALTAEWATPDRLEALPLWRRTREVIAMARAMRNNAGG